MFRWIKYVMFLCLCHCTKERLSKKEYHMDTDDKKALYAMGFEMSKRIQTFDLTDSEVETLVYGLTDSLRSKPKKEGVIWTPFITSFIDKKSKNPLTLDKAIGSRIDQESLKLGLIIRPIYHICVLSPALIIQKEQIDDLVQKLHLSINKAMNQIKDEGLWSESYDK